MKAAVLGLIVANTLQTFAYVEPNADHPSALVRRDIRSDAHVCPRGMTLHRTNRRCNEHGVQDEAGRKVRRSTGLVWGDAHNFCLLGWFAVCYYTRPLWEPYADRGFTDLAERADRAADRRARSARQTDGTTETAARPAQQHMSRHETPQTENNSPEGPSHSQANHQETHTSGSSDGDAKEGSLKEPLLGKADKTEASEN